MARPIRTFTGPKARKYLSELLAAGPGVSKEAAERVAAAIEKEIVAVKIRPTRTPAADKAPLLPFDSLPVSEPAGMEPEPEPLEAEEAEPAFDPFAFSLVVVLTKEGRDGLMRKLETIASAELLKAMAKAQHVSLPGGLTKPADIRTAIITGTERRVADRKAAAS